MINLHETMGTGLGSNFLPLDLQSDTFLQSDTLLTVLCGPVNILKVEVKTYTHSLPFYGELLSGNNKYIEN